MAGRALCEHACRDHDERSSLEGAKRVRGVPKWAGGRYASTLRPHVQLPGGHKTCEWCAKMGGGTLCEHAC